MMTTNASESFNGVLKGASALSIQALIVRTYFRLVKFFWIRREEAEQWNTSLTPKAKVQSCRMGGVNQKRIYLHCYLKRRGTILYL